MIASVATAQDIRPDSLNVGLLWSIPFDNDSRDVSGNGNNAVPSATAMVEQGAMRLGVSGSYATVPDGDRTYPSDGARFTIASTFVLTNQSSTLQYIVAIPDAAASTQGVIYLYAANNGFDMYASDGTGYDGKTYSVGFQTNVIVTLVCVYDATQAQNSHLVSYKDGQLITGSNFSNRNFDQIGNTATYATIGSDKTPTEFVAGRILDVRYYERLLTKDEVQHYDALAKAGAFGR